MDVLRSNYSTIGPLAQAEAPGAPEYPYTDIMNAYRGAFEAADGENGRGHSNWGGSDDSPANAPQGIGEAGGAHHRAEDGPATSSPGGGGGPNDEGGRGRWHSGGNHTKAFQRILNHFFGDYFSEDADEELASDMAERWSSFARSGEPNYEGSKAVWLPWRYRPLGAETGVDGGSTEKAAGIREEKAAWSPVGESPDGEGWSDYDSEDEWDLSDYYTQEEDDEFEEDVEGLGGDMDPLAVRQQYYRRKALMALQMEEVDSGDPYRTELRRAREKNARRKDGDSGGGASFTRRLLFGGWHLEDDEPPTSAMSRASAREAIMAAQDLGVLGAGLRRELVPGGRGGGSAQQRPPTEDFFPELLELSWPPEGRLIERDCTCDLWDRIRCEFLFQCLGLSSKCLTPLTHHPPL